MKKIIALIVCIVLATALCVTAVACDSLEVEQEKYPNGVVVVGITDYAPMDYKVAGNDEWIGFDADLARVVFEKLGYKVRFMEINWDNKYADLNSGAIDCVWNGFTSNSVDDDGQERSTKVDFSYNYMNNKQCVVIKNGTFEEDPTSIEDLYGKKGSYENSSAGNSFFDASFKDEEGNYTATAVGAPKQMGAIQEVLAESSDFAVVDYLLAKALIDQGGAYANLKMVSGIDIDNEFYAIAFKKGSAFTAKVNAQLEALGKDGTLKTIATKYSLENQVITDFADQK